jgi:hypothetical protein
LFISSLNEVPKAPQGKNGIRSSGGSGTRPNIFDRLLFLA